MLVDGKSCYWLLFFVKACQASMAAAKRKLKIKGGAINAFHSILAKFQEMCLNKLSYQMTNRT